MSVIKHDFGKEERSSARRLRKLLSLDALHEANLRANPRPYLERASERIYQLRKILFEAAAAAKPNAGEPPPSQTIEVSKAAYQRLLACHAIVEKGLAAAGSDDDDL